MLHIEQVHKLLIIFVCLLCVADATLYNYQHPEQPVQNVTTSTNGTTITSATSVPSATANHIFYDQSQSGKFNIHLVIKDVAIIEMDHNDVPQSYDAEDYYYDEADLTIKPLNFQSMSTTTATNISTTMKQQISTTKSPVGINADLTATIPLKTAIPNDLIKFSKNITYLDKYKSSNSNSTFISASSLNLGNKVEPNKPLASPHQKFNKLATNKTESESVVRPKGKPFTRIHHIKPCRVHEFKDVYGRCHPRGRTSSATHSILYRLFSLLTKFPIAQDDQ